MTMKGFTLIEMLVSVALFSVVMVVALGALLAVSASDRKAESLKAVINNLNFSVDSLSRAVRTGTAWGCGSPPVAGTNCQTGANAIVFTSSAGMVTYYRLESSVSDSAANAQAICGQGSLSNPGCIVRSTTGAGGPWLPITSPEVVIQDCSVANSCGASSPSSFVFYLVGAVQGGSVSPEPAQPKLDITLAGYVQVSGSATSQSQCSTASNPTTNQCSVFHVQTSVTQRVYDQ